MKYILSVLCILSLNVFGKNIYVSPNGNNTTGLSPTTAFKTLAKLNSMWASVAAGDFVLFERGYTYNGWIQPVNDGKSVNRITFDALGKGSNPVIVGLYIFDAWSRY